MMMRALLTCALVLVFAPSAFGAEAKYVLETPGVVWGGTSAKARAAVEDIDQIQSVETDMNDHTVTVEFDDEDVSLDQIIEALNRAGYTVPSHSKVE